MKKILLVEDNEMNRDMLSRTLAKRGFEVSFAFDGKEGVQKSLNDSPDLVLMDMSLPELDGWQAVQEIRKDSRGLSVPIIALTAHALEGEKDRALASGCDDFDTKPVDLERLLGKINALLTNGRQLK